MKIYKFDIIFLNDCKLSVYASGFTDAIILGMAKAIKNAWDKRMKSITDEKGVTVKNISSVTFDFE